MSKLTSVEIISLKVVVMEASTVLEIPSTLKSLSSIDRIIENLLCIG